MLPHFLIRCAQIGADSCWCFSPPSLASHDTIIVFSRPLKHNSFSVAFNIGHLSLQKYSSREKPVSVSHLSVVPVWGLLTQWCLTGSWDKGTFTSLCQHTRTHAVTWASSAPLLPASRSSSPAGKELHVGSESPSQTWFPCPSARVPLGAPQHRL